MSRHYSVAGRLRNGPACGSLLAECGLLAPRGRRKLKMTPVQRQLRLGGVLSDPVTSRRRAPTDKNPLRPMPTDR